MIKGAMNWNDKKIWFSQVNNAIEKYNKNTGVQGFLETCGPSAATICIAAMSQILPDGNFAALGFADAVKVQPEDLLFIHLLSPANYVDAIKIPNRVAECYPSAVSAVFKRDARIEKDLTFAQVAALLSAGHSIQFAFYDPNHFGAMVAYDDEKKVILRVDPWPGNDLNKKGGWLEEVSELEFKSNIKPKFIVYG